MSATDTRKRAAEKIEQVSIAQIRHAQDNVRGPVGDVAELAMSIKSVGVIEPLILTTHSDGYEVVAGHRRLAAAAVAGLDTVPGIVREFTSDGERILAMAIENLQREDLGVLAEARAYKTLLDQLDCTQRELAQRVGRTQGHISKRLSLLELPADVQSEVDSGGINVAGALALGKLAAHPERIKNVLEQYDPDTDTSDDLAEFVNNEVEELEREQKIAALRKELVDAGVTIVELGGPWHDQLPKGAVRISKEGGYTELKIDPAKHASEPCHAAAIRTVSYRGDPVIVYVCTDRTRHPKHKMDSERHSLDATRAQTKNNEEHRELETARKTRRAFLAALVKKRIPKADHGTIVFDTLIRSAHAEVLKIACKALDLEVEGTAYGAALRTHAAKSDADRQRVELAIACGTHEEFLSSWYGWEDHADYFALLKRHGYKPADVEKKKLAKS